MVTSVSRILSSDVVKVVGTVAFGVTVAAVSYKLFEKILFSETPQPSNDSNRASQGSSLHYKSISTKKGFHQVLISPGTPPEIRDFFLNKGEADKIVICPPCGVNIISVEYPIHVEDLDSHTRLTLKTTGETCLIDNKIGAIYKIVMENEKPKLCHMGAHMH